MRSVRPNWPFRMQIGQFDDFFLLLICNVVEGALPLPVKRVRFRYGPLLS
jgi:hypothetical protein